MPIYYIAFIIIKNFLSIYQTVSQEITNLFLQIGTIGTRLLSDRFPGMRRNNSGNVEGRKQIKS